MRHIAMPANDFALYGAAPRFEKPIPVGQLYFPSFEKYERSMQGIFERQYFNNNGPLLIELERQLREFFHVRHVICVSNATLGLMMLADALQLRGKVITPSFTFIASAQSISQAGLTPVFCDVNIENHHIDIPSLERVIDKDVCAIMGVNLWGGTCDPTAIEQFALQHGLEVYFDSAQALGCRVENKPVGGFGRAEVFSFHATKILTSAEGGCICTNDDEIADRLCGTRPSYGVTTIQPVRRVANARMSEAQAAVALLSLEDFPSNLQNNKSIFEAYQNGLQNIPGLSMLSPVNVSHSNHQYVVCRIDSEIFGLSRDMLVDILRAENILARRYFYPGAHKSTPYFNKSYGTLNNTEILCDTCFQLPIGALISTDSAKRIADLIHDIHRSSSELRAKHKVSQ